MDTLDKVSTKMQQIALNAEIILKQRVRDGVLKNRSHLGVANL